MATKENTLESKVSRGMKETRQFSGIDTNLMLLVNLVFMTWKDWVSSQCVNSNFLDCSRKLTSPVKEWKSPLLRAKTRACSKILNLESLSVTLFTQIYRTRLCSVSLCDVHIQSWKHDVTHRFMSPLIHLTLSSAVKWGLTQRALRIIKLTPARTKVFCLPLSWNH